MKWHFVIQFVIMNSIAYINTLTQIACFQGHRESGILAFVVSVGHCRIFSALHLMIWHLQLWKKSINTGMSRTPGTCKERRRSHDCCCLHSLTAVILIYTSFRMSQDSSFTIWPLFHSKCVTVRVISSFVSGMNINTSYGCNDLH